MATALKKSLNNRALDPTHAVFGLDMEGHVFDLPLSEGPHFLICGQTGSGKSVYMNAILVSVMAHATPYEVKMTWIDPKKVEATAYVGLPYCPIDPVTDMNDAYGLIQFYTWEMDRRYDLLADLNVKNLAEYNEWIDNKPEEAKKRGHEKLPYYICVIDEYADMVMQEKDVEAGIVRLGQKSRAAGIHLLIATQRPSASIVSPTLKSNIPTRVCLKVADSTNSGIILDEPGGEALKGYGDSLVKEKSGDITRVQGPFITNDEIDAIFSHLRDKYGKPETLDYKTIVVEQGLCEWAEEYEDNVPIEERHVKKPKRRGIR